MSSANEILGPFPDSESFALAADTAGPPNSMIGEMTVYLFSNSVTRGAVAHFDLPQGIDLDEPVKAHFAFGVETIGVADGDISLAFSSRYIATEELITKPLDESQSMVKPVINILAELFTVVFTLDKSLLADGDHVELRIQRIGADILDTFTGRVGIMQSVQLQFSHKLC